MVICSLDAARPPGAGGAVAVLGACRARERREYGGHRPPPQQITKNQVRRNLKCPEESMACHYFSERPGRAAIARLADGPVAAFGACAARGRQEYVGRR